MLVLLSSMVGCLGEGESIEGILVSSGQGKGTVPEVAWMTSIGGSGEEAHGHFILACEDGGFLQVGETGFIPNSAKLFVVKVNATGKLEWKKEFGSNGHNLGNSAIEVATATSWWEHSIKTAPSSNSTKRPVQRCGVRPTTTVEATPLSTSLLWKTALLPSVMSMLWTTEP